MPSSGTRSLQAQSAAATRWRRPDRDEVVRAYTEARLAEFIKRTVDAAPPLNAAQRDRLALLLRGGDAA